MKRLVILSLIVSLSALSSYGQIKIGENPQNIDPASVLELESNSRVLVITKATTPQLESIVPQRGGLVYNTDTECIHYYDGSQWINLCDAVSFSITSDAIENSTETIAITETANNYNLEVAPNSIRSEHIADGGINGVDIQNNSIGNDKLGANSVTSDELAQNSVGSTEIIDGSIEPTDLANFIPDQLLATDENGIVVWKDQNNVYELSFDKDTNILSLVPSTGAGNNSTDLAALVGSDDQTITDLSFDAANSILNLSLENGGSETVNLSALSNSGTDEQTLNTDDTPGNISILNGNAITLNVNDADANPNNELQNINEVLTDGNNAGGLLIKNIGTPVDNQDAATKDYVDSEIADIVTSGGSDPINEQNQTFEVAGGELRITDISGTLAVPLTDIDTNTQLTDADITALGYIKTDLDEQNLAQVLTQGQDANALQIKNLQNPTDPQDAATRAYVDANVGGNQNLAQVLTEGNDANAFQIKNLAAPTDPQDAATRAYVDANSGGTQNLAGVLGNGTSAGNNQINDLADPTLPQDAATQNYVETRIATILGAGGADGVVSNIVPTPTGFDVTGTNGGFNGSVDLDANFVTETELTAINIVSTDTPNSITTGLDGGAVYDDSPISAALTANTATIAIINTNLLTKEDTANKSTDGTLADNSDIDFPTEQAVKTYVDTQIGSFTGGNNMANDNLVLDADRIHDLNGNNLVFNDASGLPVTGNIGIGNLPGAPQSKLDVAGQIQARGGFAATAGTATTPSIGFYTDDDTNTGMFRPAADEIGFTVGGVEALRIEEDGSNTNVTILQSLTLENLLLDKDGDTGTPGQILSSTGTQTDWIDAPTAGAVSTDGTTISGDGNATDLSVPTGGITTDQILDGTIANEDIAANAIETANILDANVTEAKIAPGADGEVLTTVGGTTTWAAPTAGTVLSDATLDGDGQAGTPLSIADNSITSARIVDGAIANEDIAANAIETANILDANVTEAKIQPGTNGQVLTTAGGVATWAAPTAGAVVADATLDGDGQAGTPLGIADNSINSARIIDGTIVEADLAVGSVETDGILNGTILNEDIAPGAAIEGSKINPVFTTQIDATNGITSGANILMNGNVIVPDYVFQNYFLGVSELNDSYRFESLESIEEYIKKHHHLPGVTSSATAKKEGVWNLSKSNLQNLEKIEELFLHTIEQEKKIESLKKENNQLSKELEALKSQVEIIQKMLAKENE